jgi:hypothetical protein
MARRELFYDQMRQPYPDRLNLALWNMALAQGSESVGDHVLFPSDPFMKEKSHPSKTRYNPCPKGLELSSGLLDW